MGSNPTWVRPKAPGIQGWTWWEVDHRMIPGPNTNAGNDRSNMETNLTPLEIVKFIGNLTLKQ